MRICVVTVVAHGVGGMQRHTHDLVRGLVASGHDVDVICPAGAGLRAGAGGARWLLVPAVDPVGDFTSARWRRDSAAAFADAHRRRRYDVVHSEGSSGLGLLGAARRAGVPVVVEFHGNALGLARAAVRRGRARPGTSAREAYHVAWLARQHLPHRNWRAFRGCEWIVPSRQQVPDTRRSHLLRGDQVHVVPNGVDPELWRPREPPPRRRPLLVATGRLAPDKGFRYAIEAMRSLDAELVVVGEGEERVRLEELARAAGAADRVTFEPSRPPEDLAPLVASSAVYLFPTVREEAAPLVLPEAMACGVAVVASRIGGIPEVVDRPGENGVLVPPADVPALVRAVRALLADPARRSAIGAAARARVLAEYTLDRMVGRTVEVYEAAVAGAGREMVDATAVSLRGASSPAGTRGEAVAATRR